MHDSIAKVILRPNAKIRFGCTSIRAEAPSELRDGAYDIEDIGAFTYIGGEGTIVRHTGRIGRFCSIAPNAAIGLTEHPTHFLSPHHIFQGGGLNQLDSDELRAYRTENAGLIEESAQIWRETAGQEKIQIGNDVWIGEGVLIARGVRIGDGAVIASKSVVTKSVAPYTIVGGVPARIIRKRFNDALIEKLLELNWTRYGLRALTGALIHDPEKAVAVIERNIRNGLEPYSPPVYSIDTNRGIHPL